MTNPNQVNDVPTDTQSEGVGEALCEALFKSALRQAYDCGIEQGEKQGVAADRGASMVFEKNEDEAFDEMFQPYMAQYSDFDDIHKILLILSTPVSELNRENEPKASEATKNPLNKER